MNDQELSEVIDNAILKLEVEKYVIGVLKDAKEVIKELPEAVDFANLVIVILDKKTDTGIFDIIDAPIAKMIANKLISASIKKWYVDERAKLLGLADEAGI
jgi:hypothetical protein